MSVYNIFLEQGIIQEQHHNYIFFLNTKRIEFPLLESFFVENMKWKLYAIN